jgi:hypothetical protein
LLPGLIFKPVKSREGYKELGFPQRMSLGMLGDLDHIQAKLLHLGNIIGRFSMDRIGENHIGGQF